MTATQEILKIIEKNNKKDLTKEQMYDILKTVKGR
jgi:hypothetical protein